MHRNNSSGMSGPAARRGAGVGVGTAGDTAPCRAAVGCAEAAPGVPSPRRATAGADGEPGAGPDGGVVGAAVGGGCVADGRGVTPGAVPASGVKAMADMRVALGRAAAGLGDSAGDIAALVGEAGPAVGVCPVPAPPGGVKVARGVGEVAVGAPGVPGVAVCAGVAVPGGGVPRVMLSVG